MQSEKETSSKSVGNTHVVRSPLSVRELRVGNYLMKDGIMVRIDARSIFDIWEQTKDYQPILLTEEIMTKFRREIRPDFCPIEFDCRPPQVRQIENNFWSSWINDDYKLHLSPNYDSIWNDGEPTKSKETKFWFIWYSGISWFLPIKDIHQNPLRYVHELQNLFYQLSGYDLVLR